MKNNWIKVSLAVLTAATLLSGCGNEGYRIEVSEDTESSDSTESFDNTESSNSTEGSDNTDTFQEEDSSSYDGDDKDFSDYADSDTKASSV